MKILLKLPINMLLKYVCIKNQVGTRIRACYWGVNSFLSVAIVTRFRDSHTRVKLESAHDRKYYLIPCKPTNTIL